ncbi:hypothetical protein [Ralstonia solanacearum]|uniref:hypothetical protein n=1 Tax=Ralstonia solanacearum TaxID=305 RepID=UPI001FFD0EC2|nr:hypothetical protein [Ralstonia solanacearum]
MKRCPECSASRPYKLSDGRLKCRACGKRFSWTSVWDSVRLSSREKTRLLELFVLGVPVYRQRFDRSVSAKSRERFYRLIRACMAQQEQLREPFTGALNATKPRLAGLGTANGAGEPRARWWSSASSNATAK